MEELFLDDNVIETLENLNSLIHLRTLSIRDNLISKIENIFNLKNLTLLDLSGNAIERIPSNIRLLEKLRILKLAYNRLSVVNYNNQMHLILLAK